MQFIMSQIKGQQYVSFYIMIWTASKVKLTVFFFSFAGLQLRVCNGFSSTANSALPDFTES